MGLLKRNSVDRMAFDIFFNHVFMHKPETPKPVDPVAFMPAEDTFTPPKEPSPMQLAQQETLGAYFGAILINTSNETETRNSIIIVDLPTTFASVLDLPEQ